MEINTQIQNKIKGNEILDFLSHHTPEDIEKAIQEKRIKYKEILSFLPDLWEKEYDKFAQLIKYYKGKEHTIFFDRSFSTVYSKALNKSLKKLNQLIELGVPINETTLFAQMLYSTNYKKTYDEKIEIIDLAMNIYQENKLNRRNIIKALETYNSNIIYRLNHDDQFDTYLENIYKSFKPQNPFKLDFIVIKTHLDILKTSATNSEKMNEQSFHFIVKKIKGIINSEDFNELTEQQIQKLSSKNETFRNIFNTIELKEKLDNHLNENQSSNKKAKI